MKYTIEYTEDDRIAMLCSIHWLEISTEIGNIWNDLGDIANALDLPEKEEQKLRALCSRLYALLEMIEHQ